MLQWDGQTTQQYEQNKTVKKKESKKSFGELLADNTQPVKRKRDNEEDEDEKNVEQKKKKKKRERKRVSMLVLYQEFKCKT